jgi:hypothetical protein
MTPASRILAQYRIAPMQVSAFAPQQVAAVLASPSPVPVKRTGPHPYCSRSLSMAGAIGAVEPAVEPSLLIASSPHFVRSLAPRTSSSEDQPARRLDVEVFAEEQLLELSLAPDGKQAVGIHNQHLELIDIAQRKTRILGGRLRGGILVTGRTVDRRPGKWHWRENCLNRC